MTWLSWHEKSEHASSNAHAAQRAGNAELARHWFEIAAAAEVKALEELDPQKQRTLGITAVSATALWFKAKNYAAAEAVALKWLSSEILPPFAIDELRSLVQAVWTNSAMETAGVKFLSGQVLVSISGGQVVTGGAPLDLIVERVQIVQSLFYRTIEFLIGAPHRSRGGPSAEVQNSCRPWLFQAAPGSYQFSVAVEEQKQMDFFRAGPAPSQVADSFLSILRASGNSPDTELPKLVPSPEYRSTFLKLARNLAPNGKSLTKVEVRAADDTRSAGVILGVEARKEMSHVLRPKRVSKSSKEPKEIELNGVLRAVHLDQDWLEIVIDGKTIKIRGLPAAVDDLIGPMVNRKVVVHAMVSNKGAYRFVDVESDD